MLHCRISESTVKAHCFLYQLQIIQQLCLVIRILMQRKHSSLSTTSSSSDSLRGTIKQSLASIIPRNHEVQDMFRQFVGHWCLFFRKRQGHQKFHPVLGLNNDAFEDRIFETS